MKENANVNKFYISIDNFVCQLKSSFSFSNTDLNTSFLMWILRSAINVCILIDFIHKNVLVHNYIFLKIKVLTLIYRIDIKHYIFKKFSFCFRKQYGVFINIEKNL